MRNKLCLSFISLIFASQTLTTQAAQITFDPVHTGRLEIGAGTKSYTVYDPEYPYDFLALYHVEEESYGYKNVAGLDRLAFGPRESGRTSPGPVYTEYSRWSRTVGYGIYDLSSLFFDVESATFQIDVDTRLMGSRVGGLSIGLIDTLTPQEVLAWPIGTLPDEIISTAPGAPPPPTKTLYADFVEGRSLSLNQGSGLYELSLIDPDIIAAINRNSGLVAFSFSYIYSDLFARQPSQVLFNSAPTLTLTGTAAVPAPATLWLFGSAIIALLAIRRNKPL
jgi:hypothetical protein